MTIVLLMLLTADPLPLSLPKAVELATAPSGNLRLEITRQTIQQAEAKKKQALGAFLPALEGNISAASQTRNLQSFGFNFPGINPFIGPYNVVDYRATASQSILDFSAIRRYQATKLQLDATTAEVKAALESTTQQVARAYVAALKAEAAVATAKANVSLAERLAALADSQKRAGTGTGLEVTRSKVQLQTEKQRLLVAENDLSRAYLELKRAIGVDLGQPVELTDRMNNGLEPPVKLEDAIASAQQTRPDLLAQQKRQAAVQMSRRSITAERLPSFGASGDYGAIGDGASYRPTRSIGVGMRISIFDGGRREARAAEAEVQVRQERLRAEDLKRQIELEVRLALQNLENARSQIDTAKLALELAESEVEQAQRRTEAGVANSVELTDAQTRLARARDNQLAAIYQFNLARIDVAAATGTMSQAVKGMVQ
jgi:outer membrane protein